MTPTALSAPAAITYRRAAPFPLHVFCITFINLQPTAHDRILTADRFMTVDGHTTDRRGCPARRRMCYPSLT